MQKRIMDLALSIIALTLLFPLMLVVALLVKLDSPGPILFRQERVGRYGKIFRILKFRTMAHSVDNSGPLLTNDNDERITRIGQILRANKLDEIPQFYNVLIGDMSIVGPRPEVPKYVDRYPHDLRDKIFSIRPGITDQAAIEFRNESEMLAGKLDPERAYVEEILPAKIQLYEHYVDSQSTMLDICIILRTFRAVFAGRSSVGC